MPVTIRVDPHPSSAELNDLIEAAWDHESIEKDFSPILSRSLTHVCAYDGVHLIGYVNVAWDGADHAFILDTCVRPSYRRKGVATAIINKAEEVSRGRGARWLHVDFEPHLTSFYRRCGFRTTEAGLIKLRS